MSAAGLLRSDNVIFYHPLDSDNKERTTNEVWSGVAVHVPGKVGDAESAITTTDVSIAPDNLIISGHPPNTNIETSPRRIAKLSDTKVVTIWQQTIAQGGDGFAKGAVGTVNGTVVTWEEPVTFRSENPEATSSSIGLDLIALDSTHVVAIYNRSSIIGGFAKLGTVSGTTLTWGSEFEFASLRMNGELICRAIDETTFVVAYRDGSITGRAKAQIGSVSGTTLTFGPLSEINTNGGNETAKSIELAIFSPTVIVSATASDDATRVGSISGSTITWGPAIPIDTTTQVTVTPITSTKAIYAFGGQPPTTRVAEIVGTGITFGPVSLFDQTAFPFGFSIEMGAFASGLVGLAYSPFRDGSTISIGRVSGMDVTWGPAFGFSDRDDSGTTMTILTSKKLIFIGTDSHSSAPLAGNYYSIIGVLDSAAGLSGLGVYPSVSGATRVAMAMWARNITGNSSTITVERGYGINITPSSISIGDGTALWDGAGIDAILSSASGGMNDDGSHLLVLDFQNISGPNWQLRTSVDGTPFVDQGQQTSGSQPIITVDTIPLTSITDGGDVTQWIDELVLWAGDRTTFDRFTDGELINLFNLAASGGFTMGQFATFTSDGTPLKVIHQLTKIGDYDPQLISSFDTAASSVNIEVWDVIDGQNTSVSIVSSGCYQIGNTNNWGWSTEHLPFLNQHKKSHYYFRMTSSESEEQFGEFLITVPEDGRSSYPDSLNDSIVQ